MIKFTKGSLPEITLIDDLKENPIINKIEGVRDEIGNMGDINDSVINQQVRYNLNLIIDDAANKRCELNEAARLIRKRNDTNDLKIICKLVEMEKHVDISRRELRN
jgi:hypothetical protein